MDLSLYGRVIWRFRWLVVLGLILAIALAVLSVAKVSSHGLSYRKHEVWQSSTTVLLTQHGFPWGRAVVPPSPVRSHRRSGLAVRSHRALRAVRQQRSGEGADAPRRAPARLDAHGGSGDSVRIVIGAAGDSARRACVLAGRRGTGDARRPDSLPAVRQEPASAARPSPRASGSISRFLQNVTPPVVIQPRKKTLPSSSSSR